MNNQQGELFTPVIGLGAYRELIAPIVQPRQTDPETSHAAVKNVRKRAGSQQWQVLNAYAQHVNLTADEVGVITGLANKVGCCYWHRVSELLKQGLLETTELKRLARSGEMQRVNRITNQGRAALGI